MKRLAALSAAAAVATLGVGTAIGIAPASAAPPTITEVGWWSSNPASSAPDKGIAVQASPTGSVISIAAVRATEITGQLETAVLILREAGGVSQDRAQLKVCATPNNWKAVAKGPIADAPKPECERGEAILTRDAPNAVWSADVKALLAATPSGTAPSLMVVPAGGGTVPVGFEVRFNPPELRATESASAESSSSEVSDEFSSAASEFKEESSSSSGGSSSSFSSSDFASSSSSSSSSFSSSSPSRNSFVAEAESFVPPAAVVVPEGESIAPAAVAAPPIVESTPQAAQFSARSTSTEGGGFPVEQGLFFVALATVVGVGSGIARGQLRRIGILGS